MLQGEARLVLGPTRRRCLDYHRSHRHTAHNDIAHEEVGWPRRRVGPELRHQGSTLTDLLGQGPILFRVDRNERAMSYDRDGSAILDVERGPMGSGVNAPGQARENGYPLPGEIPASRVALLSPSGEACRVPTIAMALKSSALSSPRTQMNGGRL